MGKQDNNTHRTFFISVTLVVILFMGGISIGTAMATRNLIREETLARARAHFESIVLMRKWVASYGGVYVKKGPGVESNPYLVNPDITALDGTVYTKRNPALMTRELSEMAKENNILSFRITSLNPINYANRPDSFEQGALLAFAARTQPELTTTEQRAGRSFFRYMAPLMVEGVCMECHAAQGYQEGDVRGGISVSFDTDRVERRLKRKFLLITLSGLIAAGSLLTMIFFFATRMIRQLSASRARMEELAITDELTGLYNRRHAFARFSDELQKVQRGGGTLSCLVLDLDHFKRINDEHGHGAGDTVLRVVAAALRSALRPYDILARIGGEEFLVILPDTGRDEALLAAERMRLLVAQTTISCAPDHLSLAVTVSIGIATAGGGDVTTESILSRADRALYGAKRAGRNRCFHQDVEPVAMREEAGPVDKET